MLDYLKHFDDYYGKGEHSEERKQAVQTFCSYAKHNKLNSKSLLSLVAKLDTTQGVPAEHQIVMTSIFRTKGLEYDYVIIPNCTERYMPCSLISSNQIYDKAGLISPPPESASIENERRLFYVALTRARKGVYIGAAASTTEDFNGHSPQCSSRFLNELALEPTVEIMSAMQGCVSDNPNAESGLLASIAKNSRTKSILSNLVSHYLKGKKFRSLKRKVRNLANREPEQKPLNFEEDRPDHKTQESRGNPFEEQPWWINNH